MWLLLLMACMILLFLLPGILFSKYWNKGLSVRVSFVEPFVFEGDNSSLVEEIVNDKYLPIIALAVRLSVSKELRFSQEAEQNTSVTDQTYKRDIFSLPAFAKVKRKLPFTARKRGFYEITSTDVTAYDYFFKDGYKLEIAEKSHIYVYPRTVDISRINTINAALQGMLLTKRLILQDPFTFAGIREYMKGDPMSQINWKASAKGQELMVNQYDATTAEDITILLDLEDRNIIKEEALIEESIRIAASLCESLIARRMTLRLVSNAESLNYNIKAGEGTLDDMFRAFAVVQTDKVEQSFTDILSAELLKNPEDVIYVVISKNANRELKTALEELRRQSKNQYFWVLPYTAAHSERANEYCSANCLGWEVSR